MAAFGIILGLLPGFAWLTFYLREDCHPEPRRIIALTFVNGAAFAFFALVAQVFLDDFFSANNIARLSVVALLAFSAVEEFLKFFAAYAAVHKNPVFDEPIDAMIYAIVASLGFATVENIGVVVGSPGESLFLANIFHVVTFRFIGATLLHTLTSGIMGYYWAKSIRRFNSKRLILTGFVVATLIHTAFNVLILRHGEAGLPLILLAAVGFFVLRDFESLREKVV